MNHKDQYSQLSSIIWSVSPNGWIFVYKLSACGFESRWSHLIFTYRAFFQQGVSWHWGKYRVWIHSEMRTWHENNAQSSAPYRTVLTSIIWSVWPNGWVFVYELSGCWFESRCSNLTFRYRAFLSKEFLDIQSNIECEFTLKCVRHMMIKYSQMHRIDKYYNSNQLFGQIGQMVECSFRN